jgi:hypothetical protein
MAGTSSPVSVISAALEKQGKTKYNSFYNASNSSPMQIPFISCDLFHLVTNLTI